MQWDSSTHPGPITHFLFGPTDGGAEGAAGTGAGWFKIDELAYEGGQWANEIMAAKEMKYSFRLPEALPAGEYLVSLHHFHFHFHFRYGTPRVSSTDVTV